MTAPYHLRFVASDPGGGTPHATILPVPYDRTACYQAGARNGPDAVLHASIQMEYHDELLGADLANWRIETLAPLDPRADSPEAMHAEIRDAVAEIMAGGSLPVVIGGDHSVTLGAARGVAAHVPDLGVLHLDAHADLRDSYEGSRSSHACVARRLREDHPVISMGVRSWSAEEGPHIRPEEMLTARGWHADEGAAMGMLENLPEKVYLTLDVDVFDPSIMPATGTPEPGGMDWYRVDRVLEWLGRNRTVVGFDVVELMPIPGLIAPEYLVARLIARSIVRFTGGRTD